MAVGKSLELLVDEDKTHDELNNNVENVFDYCDRSFQKKVNDYSDDDYHVDVDFRHKYCNSEYGCNAFKSFLDITIVENYNVNRNDDGVVSEIQDNNVYNVENESFSNAN